jgi:hypothetical protein
MVGLVTTPTGVHFYCHRGLPGLPTMNSSSSNESEHDEHDQEYEPHCKRTRTAVNDGAGPSVVRFGAEVESTWDCVTGHRTSP